MKKEMKVDTTVTNFPITKTWEKGKLALKEDRLDDARDCFDQGLAMISAYSQIMGDNSDELVVEGKARSLWLMRLWVALEKNNLLLG
jgi:hypothetical protein